MRVFIAVELDDEVKDQLDYIQNQLTLYTSKGNFTKRDNFHLTLRFIGEVEEVQLESIKRVVDRVAERVQPFQLNLNSLGTFPKKNRHIMWTGVSGDLNELQAVHEDLEKALEELGLKKDPRPYNPHLTLGRQIVLKKDLVKVSEEVTVPASEITVNKLSLIESTRVDGDLVYRPIYSKKLT